MRRICGTCKHMETCEHFEKGREEWTCLSYAESDSYQISMEQMVEVMNKE